MPNPKNKKLTPEVPKKIDNTRADNMKMVLEKHERQNNKPTMNNKPLPKKFKQPVPEKITNPINMVSPLYTKISDKCKSAAKRKFEKWPSAYASFWGVKCTKAGGPDGLKKK